MRIFITGGLFIYLLIFFSIAVTAQQGQGQGKRLSATARAERMTQQLQQDLNLSDEQRLQVAEINLRASQEMEALRNNTSLNRGDRRTQNLLIQNKRKAEINALLTQEQQALFAKHQMQNMSDRQSGRNKPARGSGGAGRRNN